MKRDTAASDSLWASTPMAVCDAMAHYAEQRCALGVTILTPRVFPSLHAQRIRCGSELKQRLIHESTFLEAYGRDDVPPSPPVVSTLCTNCAVLDEIPTTRRRVWTFKDKTPAVRFTARHHERTR